MVPRKPAKFENPGWNFPEISFVIYSRKTGKYLNQNFFTGGWPKIVWIKQCFSIFGSTRLTCDPTVFPGKIITNIAESNSIFSGKGRGDKVFILTYFVSWMAEVFPLYCLFCFDFDHLQEEKRGQSWAKSANFGPVPFSINTRLFQKIFKQYFKQYFCLLEYYLWWEFRQYWTILGE